MHGGGVITSVGHEKRRLSNKYAACISGITATALGSNKKTRPPQSRLWRKQLRFENGLAEVVFGSLLGVSRARPASFGSMVGRLSVADCEKENENETRSY